MEPSPTANCPILVLCRDLLFTSKITGTASAQKVAVRVIRDPAKLAGEAGSRRLIVDLTQEGYLAAAVVWKGQTGGHVTGFAGHTDVGLITEARAKGVDLVLSRGEFSAQMAQVLAINPQ